MKLLARLILFLLTLPFSAGAASPAFCQELVDRLLPAFEESFATSYRPLMCSDNTKRWGQRLQELALDLNTDFSSAQAVHIRHKWAPHYPVLPANARTIYRDRIYQTPKWSFHSIAIFEGLVFDLDFSNRVHITGVNKYLEQMWPDQTTRDYVIQSKPLTEYQGKDLYGLFNETEFPSLPFDSRRSDLSQGLCAEYEAIAE